MHIKKYDFDYSRRFFMEKVAKGAGSAGIFGALFPIMAETGTHYKAYPEELMSIEAYTKGKVKVGDTIDKNNIDLVQDLVDPMLYQEVTQDNRTFFILPTQAEIEKQFPPYYLDATLKNWGQAKFGDDGNVYTTDGKPWIGGHPFPDPQTPEEVQANVVLSWGRHDADIFAIPTYALDQNGDIQYEYHFVWAQQQTIGLVHPDCRRRALPAGQGTHAAPPVGVVHRAQRHQGHGVHERVVLRPGEVPGTLRLPARVQARASVPDQPAFEPLVAGINLFLSDAWAAGDPMLTWGNWKIVHRARCSAPCITTGVRTCRTGSTRPAAARRAPPTTTSASR